ncbi:nucleotidyltransferase family protein [Candidatus Woesearchaeota archaeon]|nr:nucleotidyltransferase family protein [Candidatus Woesearchaeota archaeon]
MKTRKNQESSVSGKLHEFSRKPKIAISVDKSLLEMVDSKVDGSVIRSRSQAIEFFLRKGLQGQSINTAVLLIKGEHQQNLLKKFKGKSLLKKQIEFFSKYGIKNLYILTQHSKNINFLLNEISNADINVEIIEKESKGNANALAALKDKLKNNFVVMSGDTYNNFDLLKMIKKHIEMDKLAAMGLMTRENPADYGIAILDGDLIIDFREKPKQYSTNIVNAGIYIFKPEIFELFENANSLEKELFPRLARLKQLTGFFTYGEYEHFG